MVSRQCKKRGFGIVEFIILIALIALAAIVAVTTIGSSPKEKLYEIKEDIPPQPTITPDFESSYEVSTENDKTKVTISVIPTNTTDQSLNSLSFDLKDLNSEIKTQEKVLCHAEIDLNETGSDTGWDCDADGTIITCNGLTPFEVKTQTSVAVFLLPPFVVPDPPDYLRIMINGELPVRAGIKF